MADQRNRRPWVKVQLPNTPPGYEVARIVTDWKRQRRATVNLISAIRLYAALLAGDTSVLYELFPGLGFGIGSAAPGRRPKAYSEPVVTMAPASVEDEQDDLLGLLGDDMDFG